MRKPAGPSALSRSGSACRTRNLITTSLSKRSLAPRIKSGRAASVGSGGQWRWPFWQRCWAGGCACDRIVREMSQSMFDRPRWFQNDLLMRVIENDSELAQDADANVPGKAAFHRRALQEKICFGLLDYQATELQFGHRTDFGLSVASHANPAAAAGLA